ncbi:hypothetical protein [Erwinia sp. PsM31]|uniref:hypothetical protein n=1 Tax=Erwinia sp. PsM31 TaxID=3030535 RepID=UPI00263B8C7A|nr:hypothetical protein [Erwinia sp. PsM31]MDN4626511.1 hypothetical protein [Erwinia sp. PsM31]
MDINQIKIFMPGFISTLGEFLQIKDDYKCDSIIFLDRNIVGRLKIEDFPKKEPLDNIRFSALYAIWEANASRVPTIEELHQQFHKYQSELRKKFGDAHVTDDSAVLYEKIIPSMLRYLTEEHSYLEGYLALSGQSIENRLDYIFDNYELRLDIKKRLSGINPFLVLALLSDLLGDSKTKRKGEVGTVLKAASLFSNGSINPVTLYNIRSDFSALFLFWSMCAQVQEAWRKEITSTRIFFATNDKAMSRLFELSYNLARVLQHPDMSEINDKNVSRLACVTQHMFPRLKEDQLLLIWVIQQIQRLRILG